MEAPLFTEAGAQALGPLLAVLCQEKGLTGLVGIQRTCRRRPSKQYKVSQRGAAEGVIPGNCLVVVAQFAALALPLFFLLSKIRCLKIGPVRGECDSQHVLGACHPVESCKEMCQTPGVVKILNLGRVQEPAAPARVSGHEDAEL